jgi:putative Mg2+ transporter-C (MgtC) family protein
MEYITPYFTYIVDFVGPINPLTIVFLKALLLSLFLGYIMGAEREFRGKDAGISTNMFVITGSMIFTFLSMTVDPHSESRIAAQIVSGIGFLGAGLILREGTGVRNLTTAASVWFAGAVGMLIGFGFYGIAFIAGVAGVLIPRVRHIQNQIETVEHVIDAPAKKTRTKKTQVKKK